LSCCGQIEKSGWNFGKREDVGIGSLKERENAAAISKALHLENPRSLGKGPARQRSKDVR